MKSEIITVESAFTLLGRDYNAIKSAMELLPQDIREHHLADIELKTIIEAKNMEANGGKPWKPDWNNNDEDKREPWFRMWDNEGQPAGSGFSYARYVYWNASSGAGSRLCYINYDVMKDVTDNFLPIYKKVFLS